MCAKTLILKENAILLWYIKISKRTFIFFCLFSGKFPKNEYTLGPIHQSIKYTVDFHSPLGYTNVICSSRHLNDWMYSKVHLFLMSSQSTAKGFLAETLTPSNQKVWCLILLYIAHHHSITPSTWLHFIPFRVIRI